MSLLGLRDKSREEILYLLDRAGEFLGEDGNLETPPEYREKLAGESVGLLFFEPSTRTRVSFELAVRRLGGFSVTISDRGSSVQKGESLLDTCRNLEAMGVGALVMRHRDRELIGAIGAKVGIPIVNAGNGSDEHPTQALLDLLTLQRALGREGRGLEGKKVAIVGDVIHSRVARSDVYGLRALGAEVVIGGPEEWVPRGGDEGWGVKVVGERREALCGADAVIMLRVQRERMVGERVDEEAYIRAWGLDDKVAQRWMKDDAIIMHPGPVIRGMELSGALAEGRRSRILEQVKHGVAVRQAVLVELFSRTSRAKSPGMS